MSNIFIAYKYTDDELMKKTHMYDAKLVACGVCHTVIFVYAHSIGTQIDCPVCKICQPVVELEEPLRR